MSVYINVYEDWFRVENDWASYKGDINDVSELRRFIDESDDYISVETTWSRDKFDGSEIDEIVNLVENLLDEGEEVDDE